MTTTPVPAPGTNPNAPGPDATTLMAIAIAQTAIERASSSTLWRQIGLLFVTVGILLLFASGVFPQETGFWVCMGTGGAFVVIGMTMLGLAFLERHSTPLDHRQASELLQQLTAAQSTGLDLPWSTKPAETGETTSGDRP